MLGLWSYAYAYDDPYVAGLTSFLCFAFCFALMLMLSCEPGLTYQCSDTKLFERHGDRIKVRNFRCWKRTWNSSSYLRVHVHVNGSDAICMISTRLKWPWSNLLRFVTLEEYNKNKQNMQLISLKLHFHWQMLRMGEAILHSVDEVTWLLWSNPNHDPNPKTISV